MIRFILALLLLTNMSHANEGSHTQNELLIEQILVTDAWARPMFGNKKMMSAYMKIINNTNNADEITNIRSSEFIVVDTNKTVIENSISKVVNVEKIVLPANGVVEFKPGSIHIVLLGPRRMFNIGDSFKLLVTFKKAEAMEINVTIRSSKS
jgi:periplasmic copper chaperone A